MTHHEQVPVQRGCARGREARGRGRDHAQQQRAVGVAAARRSLSLLQAGPALLWPDEAVLLQQHILMNDTLMMVK